MRPIYDADRAGLLFRVIYHQQRVILEVFRAVRWRGRVVSHRSSQPIHPVTLPGPPRVLTLQQLSSLPNLVLPMRISPRDLSVDSFAQYFRPHSLSDDQVTDIESDATLTTTTKVFKSPELAHPTTAHEPWS